MASILFWIPIVTFILIFCFFFTPIGLKRIYILDNDLIIDFLFQRQKIPIQSIHKVQLKMSDRLAGKVDGFVIFTDKTHYDILNSTPIINSLARPTFDYNIIAQMVAKNPHIHTAQDLKTYIVSLEKEDVYIYKHQIVRGVLILMLLIGIILLLNTAAQQGYYFY